MQSDRAPKLAPAPPQAIYLPHAPPPQVRPVGARGHHPPPAPLARQVRQAAAAAGGGAGGTPRPSARPRPASPRRRRRRSCRLLTYPVGAPPTPNPSPQGGGEHAPSAGDATRATLPALRQVGPPSRNFADMTASLNALLARPHERSERARQVLAQQPMLATHPLVSGDQRTFTPHRPPRPEKSEGGIAFRIVVGLRAQGRPAHRHRRAGGRRQPARAQPGAARRHRLGQDLHHGQGDRGHPAPGPGAGPQQDAGRPALRRVQGLLPRQRGRVLRLLLRLLPARSLRAAHRHLHREGIVDQRADRPHAPRRHPLAAGARRRDHRRLGVVHLRHRLGRDLHGHDLHRADRRDA